MVPQILSSQARPLGFLSNNPVSFKIIFPDYSQLFYHKKYI